MIPDGNANRSHGPRLSRSLDSIWMQDPSPSSPIHFELYYAVHELEDDPGTTDQKMMTTALEHGVDVGMALSGPCHEVSSGRYIAFPSYRGSYISSTTIFPLLLSSTTPTFLVFSEERDMSSGQVRTFESATFLAEPK